MSPHSSRQGYFIFNFSRNSFGSLFKNSGFILWLLLVGLFYFPSALHAQTGPSHSKYVVGYYAEWAIYGRDFNVSDIKAENLTHLMYAFYDTKFNRATSVTTLEEIDRYADIEHTEDPGINHNSKVKGNLGAMKLLKEKNPHLVILISLGGWTKSMDFPDLSASKKGRETLAQAMVKFINTYPFIDGFDIDWEFPVEGGIGGQPHTPDDHKNLVLLLKQMRQTFKKEFPNKKKWVTMAGGNNVLNLLSTHVGPNTEADHGITENIADYTDFITFFGYDFGGNWFDKTSYNAPLYSSNNPEDPLYRTRKDTLYKGSGVPHQSLNDLVKLYLEGLGIPLDFKIQESDDASEGEELSEEGESLPEEG